MSQSLSSAGSRVERSGVSSTLRLGLAFCGLRAMKLVVGAVQTHPVMADYRETQAVLWEEPPPRLHPQPAWCVASQINSSDLAN